MVGTFDSQQRAINEIDHDHASGLPGDRRPAAPHDVQGQYATRHGRRESQDGKGCVGPYLLAIGHRGSQFQAECRHDSPAERDDQIDDPGANEDNAATGDLDIKGNVTIKGKGASKTIVDANAILDRVFQVLSGRVQISGLTIQHGQADEGGGLLNSGGQVTLTSVVVANNMAIGSSGTVGLHRATAAPASWAAASSPGPAAPAATGRDAQGGGIFNQAGTLSLSK